MVTWPHLNYKDISDLMFNTKYACKIHLDLVYRGTGSGSGCLRCKVPILTYVQW